MPRIELERIEQDEDRSETSLERFDRVAFAERVVALVRPRTTTVAISGGRRLRVESGRQWGSVGRWAVLQVSPNASKRAIVDAVLTLRAEGDDRAWTLDVLMHVCGS